MALIDTFKVKLLNDFLVDIHSKIQVRQSQAHQKALNSRDNSAI